MPFLSGAQNFVLNNSHLTDVTVLNLAGQTGIDILFEASIPDAAHDSSARDPPPRCFPGTREQYVEDIMNWALPPVGDTPLPMYWMKGPAGVGKSAVAQTCAEKLKRLRKLGAAFFFSTNRRSRNDTISINNRGDHYKFFTSIAYQLSTIYPEYHKLLDAKIRRDRSLVDKTMESQFWGLLVEPLQELEEKGLGIGARIPVFVDGLDECESREAQHEIVDIVAAAARDGVTSLCWAFFSRPEPHIEATFSRTNISTFCHKTVLPISRDADRDIDLYLRVGFENILQRLNTTVTSPWPSDSDMKELVCAAGGLFIYAKTVLRFIGQSDSLNPEELLRAIITVISNRNDQRGVITEPALAELDAFYMLIMQRIPTKMFPIIHRVLFFLSLYQHSSAFMVANVLGLSRIELEAACSQLSSVVHFQRQREPLALSPSIDTNKSFLQTKICFTRDVLDTIWDSLGGSVSFYHKSFKDFLLNPRRSGVYCVKALSDSFEKRQWDLTHQFGERHCWKGSELVRASDAPDSASSLSYPYTNELVNSFVEASIYKLYGAEISFGADFDFRKKLYITTRLFNTMFKDRGAVRATLIRCRGFRRYFLGTVICWLQPSEFPKLNVAAFKESVEGRQQRNTIRPYHSASPILSKPVGRVESGLYVMGQDSKSIFWYWEINHDLGSYRQFKTLDLVEGERLFQEQFLPS